MVSNIVREKEDGLKNQMRISGMSLPAFWLGHYVSDCIFNAIPSIVIIILISVWDISAPKGWVIITIHIFVNPIFLYFISTFYERSVTVRNHTIFIYLLSSIIFPVVVFILTISEIIGGAEDPSTL